MQTVLVTDLKQWLYCARIVYYHQVLGVTAPPTFKMQEGRLAHDLLEKLEKRRCFRRYGFTKATRRFGVWIHDPGLGLAGRIDMLLEAQQCAAVVDFKLTSGRVRENHHLQLAAYALLAERWLRRPVELGFLYRIPNGSVTPVPLAPHHRARVLEAIEEIRRMGRHQTCPEPPPTRGRCQECEFINYCADRW